MCGVCGVCGVCMCGCNLLRFRCMAGPGLKTSVNQNVKVLWVYAGIVFIIFIKLQIIFCVLSSVVEWIYCRMKARYLVLTFGEANIN